MVNPTVTGKPEHLHIGLGTVATYVHKYSDHPVCCLDFASFRRRWQSRLRKKIAEFEPDVVGLYLSTPYWSVAKDVADELKRIDPRLVVVGGGHHATFSPEEVIAHPSFDMLIRGEGEKPLVTLLDVLDAGGALEDVPGLTWREDGAVRDTPLAPILEHDRMPGIDFSLHDEESLRNNFTIWGVLPIMASRGCPADCSFCAISKMQRLYQGQAFLRFRDPMVVVDEIEADYEKYKDYGLRIVFFYDLNFLLHPKWLREFTDEYKRRGLNKKLPWTGLTRADHITDHVLESLEDSGCITLKIGIESANPVMRNDIYNKELPQDVLERAIERIKAIDITVTGYFIAGGPGERPEWLLETLEFAHRKGIEYPIYFLYKPLPGTDILERAGDLGSYVLDDTMAEQNDFLHGVNMSHEHITTRQLKTFMTLTQGLLAPRLVSAQLRREGPAWFVRMARYMALTTKLGFDPYMAISYYIFYSRDHLNDPVRLDARPTRGLRWRALMALTRTWLRDAAPSSG